MKYVIVLLVSVICLSCKNQAKEPVVTETAEMTVEQFGAPITTDNALSVNEAKMKVNEQDSLLGKVSGYVTSVCQVKGCWMQLSQNPGDTTGFFVKFKDYGFFVPLDLTGSQVVVSGKAFKEITSVDELKHYAEDEGKSKEEIEAITQPQEELKFMAEGVVVVQRKK